MCSFTADCDTFTADCDTFTADCDTFVNEEKVAVVVTVTSIEVTGSEAMLVTLLGCLLNR